jgi:hypothetical protein
MRDVVESWRRPAAPTWPTSCGRFDGFWELRRAMPAR